MNNMISIVTKTKLRCKVYSWIANRFSSVHVFISGLNSGYLGSGVAIIIDVALAKHVYRISEVPGRLLALKLLFKNKLSVSVLGLYAGASASMHLLQVDEINALIADDVNESSFVILGSNFNKNGSCKSASFKKCGALGLVNSLINSSNSQGVVKTIDYLFVSPNLVNAIVDCSVLDVSKFFDTNYQSVLMLVSLGELLDTHLCLLCKQANRDHWKYNFKNADATLWSKFKEAIVANSAMFAGGFLEAKECSDLNAMWDAIHRTMCFSANEVFKKKWFKESDGVFTKCLSRFYRLELLVSKLVKASCSVNYNKFVSLLDIWGFFDSINASVVRSLFLLGSPFNSIRSTLSKVRKSYRASKLLESKCTEDFQIRLAINKRMESFESNKGHTIRSVLKQPFCKMVLDHLVVENEMILEPDPKNCDKSVLDMLLKEAWVLIIPKPYEWKGVLMNAHPIVLIETAHKILSKIFSKILSDRISLAYSKFDVLYRDNFSVFKGTMMQSPIFAIGLAYDSVGWEHLEKSLVRIKMCGSFICFFRGIYMGCTNRVMTDFIKRQESVCGYRLVFHYILKNGCAESRTGLFSFLAAGAFVDDTIWVGSSQTATQHILDVASEFYQINNISINNNKTVVILINCCIDRPSLFISGMPITIARKEEFHRYLGIFLSTEDFSKPSMAKTHSDVHFFSNMVLKKTVSDKQFLYLVSAVLYPIASFRTQFSFILVSVCYKWDALIRKSLKLKSGLPSDFSSDTIHHLFFYGLKSFVQIQLEGKVVSFICFTNSGGVLGHLFSHRSHDLQVLCWHPVHSLCFPVHVYVSPFNNFLAGLVHILLENSLSLGGYLGNFFLSRGGVPMSTKRLDPCGSVSEWFWLSIMFLSKVASLPPRPPVLDAVGSPSIVSSQNESFKGLDMFGCRASAKVFFKDIGLGLGVSVSGSMSSTLAEMQAIALALKCVPFFSSVCLFSDSQSALNACKSELADMIADAASLSVWCLSLCLNEHFLVADSSVVFTNSRHFVRDIFRSINHAHWKVGLGSKFLPDSLLSDVNWHCSLFVWHPNLHMAFGFTSKSSIDLRTYFMKALHHWLPVVIYKHLYNRHYPSVLCLHYGKVEVSDHVFTCEFDCGAYCQILDFYMSSWSVLSGLFVSSSSVLQLLSTCVSDVFVFTALFKGFVFDGWYCEAISFSSDPKLAHSRVVEFVWSFGTAFRTEVWLLGVAEAISVHFGYRKQCAFFSGVDNSVVVHIDI
ncbi:hypothetical protein G9A89_015674 [Geosiphon pyriformis]|nr:hypothetical protein G9A89_015674 [Geosiphon pyriformis]